MTRIYLGGKLIWSVGPRHSASGLAIYIYALEGIEIRSELLSSKKECIDNTCEAQWPVCHISVPAVCRSGEQGFFVFLKKNQIKIDKWNKSQENEVLSKAATSEEVMSPNPIQNLIVSIFIALSHNTLCMWQFGSSPPPLYKAMLGTNERVCFLFHELQPILCY